MLEWIYKKISLQKTLSGLMTKDPRQLLHLTKKYQLKNLKNLEFTYNKNTPHLVFK